MESQEPTFDRRSLAGPITAVGLALTLALRPRERDWRRLAGVIRNAVGIPEESPEGLGKFVSAANRLLTPATLAAAAVMPFGVIAGGLMMGFGQAQGRDAGGGFARVRWC